ncbi:hypothetical protein MA16_Dca025112 [Dendrobium catenatum]|uniref:Uncharacterized protein n=1 Tax=Dendrobium catenatum TaxID=906689 RepID=A0A2I0WKY8_9ASPA|nr:hypothetical protein MA16_Dca025112 [Dendrobium catenatum]
MERTGSEKIFLSPDRPDEFPYSSRDDVLWILTLNCSSRRSVPLVSKRWTLDFSLCIDRPNEVYNSSQDDWLWILLCADSLDNSSCSYQDEVLWTHDMNYSSRRTLIFIPGRCPLFLENLGPSYSFVQMKP